MKNSRLGWSDEQVSRACLGSMTWGVQNNQRDADDQIEYALSRGINFIDTAEMYPIPPTAEKYGDTERIIGDWLSRHPGQRANIFLASKIAGNGLSWIRNQGNITGKDIINPTPIYPIRKLFIGYLSQAFQKNRARKTSGPSWFN